jgi:hypothetical protein
VCEEQEDEIAAASASSTSNRASPYSQKAERHIPAVYEEQEYEIAAASEELQPKEGATEESYKQSSSWFGFRRSKSPGAGKIENVPDEENDKLNNSRSHASPDLARLSLEITLSGDSTPSIDTMQLSSDTMQSDFGLSELAALNDELPEMEQTGEKASSWFSFRRSKSPITAKQDAASISNENARPDPTESTYTGDDDWLQEVMDKPSEKDATLSNDDASIDGLEERSSPPSTWFGFVRSRKTTRSPTRSRLPSLDDDAMETQPTSSFDEDTDDWIGQAMNNNSSNNNNNNNSNSSFGDGWNGSPATTGGLFFSPARSRFPTESSIQTAATEENVEDEGSLSQDLMEGMEQNLAFLNI